MELIGLRIAIVHHTRGFHVHPGALGRFVTIAPIRREPPIGARIAQLQTAASAAGILAPTTAGPISDFVNGDVNRIGLRLAERVGAHDLIGHVQLDALTAIGERPTVITKAIGKRQICIIGAQVRGIFRDDQVTAGAKDRSRRKIVGNRVANVPAANVDCIRAAIIKLDVFIVRIRTDRIEHDLVNDHVRRLERGVVRPRRRGC